MKYLKLVKNKYLLTTIGIVVWLLFFDKNDVFSQADLIGKLNKLKGDRNYLTEIRNNKREIEELKTKQKKFGKISREKYHMKKDNEDVYVIVKK